MEQLLSMGFDAASVRSALTNSNGNMDRALDLLLNGFRDPSVFSFAPGEHVGMMDDSAEILPGPIISGAEHCDLQVSQFSFSAPGAVSACTTISTYSCLLLLKELQNVLSSDKAKTIEYFSKILVDGVETDTLIRASNDSAMSAEHFSVDDVLGYIQAKLSPIGRSIKKTDDVFQNILKGSSQDFLPLFVKARDLQAEHSSAVGMVVTKPPETVCVVLHENGQDLLMFDSHGRPSLGFSGANVLKTKSTDVVLQFLVRTFPHFPCDEEAVALMYNCFECTFFIDDK